MKEEPSAFALMWTAVRTPKEPLPYLKYPPEELHRFISWQSSEAMQLYYSAMRLYADNSARSEQR